MKTEYPNLSQIQKAHAWKRDYERYMPLSRYVYRPIGFLVTWLAVRLGITTEMASYFSGILGVAGLLCLASENSNIMISGIILLHLFNLFDCVDGSIARAMKTESPYGKFLDSVIGDIINYFFFPMVGLMIFQMPSLTYIVSIGIPFDSCLLLLLVSGTTASYIFLHHVEDIYKNQMKDKWENYQKDVYRKKRAVLLNGISSREKNIKNNKHLIRLIDRNIRVRETHYLFLFIAFWFNIVDIFLYFFLAYFTSRLLSSLILYRSRAIILKRTGR